MAIIDLDLKQIDNYVDIYFDERGQLATTDTLATAVLVSMFEDQRALPEYVQKAERRRGSWQNILSRTPGFLRGSLLWLLDQSRLTQETVNRAKDFTEQCLQWMLDDGLVTKIEVDARRETGKLIIDIRLFEPKGVSEIRFPDALNNINIELAEV